MRTIWKFPFPIADEFTLRMPVAAEILHVGVQVQGDARALAVFGGIPSAFETPCLWALVDSDAEQVERRFVLRGTGHTRCRTARIGTWRHSCRRAARWCGTCSSRW